MIKKTINNSITINENVLNSIVKKAVTESLKKIIREEYDYIRDEYEGVTVKDIFKICRAYGLRLKKGKPKDEEFVNRLFSKLIEAYKDYKKEYYESGGVDPDGYHIELNDFRGFCEDFISFYN